MKVSRWRDFLRRGFFPVVPKQHIVFLRVDLQDSGICAFPFDVLLHKVRPVQDGQAGLDLETLTSLCKQLVCCRPPMNLSGWMMQATLSSHLI